MKKRNKLIFAVLILMTCFSLSGCFVDHNDGKCDICGKTASYSGTDEEYCDKHFESAVEWYIKQMD